MSQKTIGQTKFSFFYYWKKSMDSNLFYRPKNTQFDPFEILYNSPVSKAFYANSWRFLFILDSQKEFIVTSSSTIYPHYFFAICKIPSISQNLEKNKTAKNAMPHRRPLNMFI